MTAEPMETRSWRLGEEDLRRWLDRLLQPGRRRRGSGGRPPHGRVPGDRRSRRGVPEARRTAWSPKDQLLPRTESLYSYTFQDGGPQLLDPTLRKGHGSFRRPLLRRCGIRRLDETFLDGPVVDPLYAERRRCAPRWSHWLVTRRLRSVSVRRWAVRPTARRVWIFA